MTIRPPTGADEFADFVRSRTAPLLRSGYVLTGDQHLAEDLVQGAFVKLYRRWDAVRHRNPDAYVRQAMYHLQVSVWRRGKVPEAFPATMPDVGGDDHAGPTTVRLALRQALLALPARQRAVLVLRFLEDRSEAETAEILGCSLGTVKSMTSRALARLRSDAPDLRELSDEARPTALYDRVTATAARQRRQRIVAGAAFGAVLLAAGAVAVLGPVRRSAPPVVSTTGSPSAPASVSPSAAPSSSAPAVPPAAKPDPLLFYVGSWAGHGRQITARSDFSATYTGRTYVRCTSPSRLPGEPCDTDDAMGHEVLELHLERRAGRTYAVVEDSNNPGNSAGTTYELRAYPDDHYFTMRWLSGGEYERTIVPTVGLCDDDKTPREVNRDVCGA